ncbi:MAG: YdcF family protein [Planctomycetes bacterium]|nr:YdcF family protein [Planctomycetota bacterium]
MKNEPPPIPHAPADEGKPRSRGPIRRAAEFLFRGLRNVLAFMMAVVLLLAFTPLGNLLFRHLSVTVADPPKADYIVCLGGGMGREVRAAQLWHRKVAPIVIVSNRPGAAEWMRTLVEQTGVPHDRVLVDDTSYTTADHPEGIARVPGVDRHRQRFVIVTDHVHSRRAQACFLKAGYEHVTFWGGLKGVNPPTTYWEWCEWRIINLPMIVYECAATAKYTWRGTI